MVSFRHGRGVVSDEHYLGQSYPAGNRLWATADVVLAVGTRLKYPLMYWGTEGLDIIRIDIDETEIARIKKPAIGMVGDAKTTLGQLLPRVERHNRKRESRQQELQSLKADMHEEFSVCGPQVAFLNAIRVAGAQSFLVLAHLYLLGLGGRQAGPEWGAALRQMFTARPKCDSLQPNPL